MVADGGHGSVEHVDYERPGPVVDEFNLSCLDRIAEAEHGGRTVVVHQHVTVVRHAGGFEFGEVGIDQRGLMGLTVVDGQALRDEVGEVIREGTLGADLPINGCDRAVGGEEEVVESVVAVNEG